MRNKLKRLQNQRKTFVGVFKRYGKKNNWHGFPERTILLVNVKDTNGNMITEHIWFKMTKGFEKLGNLNEGAKIKFDARVKQYMKGYFGYKEEVRWERPPRNDYKLNFPTKIKLSK